MNKTLNKKTVGIIIAVGVLLLVIGICIGCCLSSMHKGHNHHKMYDRQMMSKNDMHTTHTMSGSTNTMIQGLQGKTGDEFDKAFIAEMIVHHEGAVAMAQVALQHAKHQEIKTLAEAIIAAQTAEINQMRAWQKAWYATTTPQ